MRRELTATGSAMSSLHMDPGRFLYDDGHTTSCRSGVRKTQGVRRVGGRAATSQDAGSHMRQECRVSATSLQLQQAVREAQNAVHAEWHFPMTIEGQLRCPNFVIPRLIEQLLGHQCPNSSTFQRPRETHRERPWMPWAGMPIRFMRAL